MTVFIRLMGGFEDEYPTYPTKRHVEPHPDDWDGTGYDKTVWIDVQVAAGDDGSLAVKQGSAQVGYYPSGAWMSWRTE